MLYHDGHKHGKWTLTLTKSDIMTITRSAQDPPARYHMLNTQLSEAHREPQVSLYKHPGRFPMGYPCERDKG